MGVATWYKGNIHIHTAGEGDTRPDRLVRWYEQHGYDFLVITDHGRITLLDRGPDERCFQKPLLIPGEEVSAKTLGEEPVPVHLNAIGVSNLVEPIDAEGVSETLQTNIDAILASGGIACINHPNQGWAFDQEAICQVSGANLLEVYNAWRGANVYGGVGKPSNEQIWDGVLSEGRLIYGVATDDYPDPGFGWVVVRAYELTADAIVNALALGDFYASTGIVLAELELSQESIRLVVEQDLDVLYATRFTGPEGLLLAERVGLEAEFRPRGDEGFVRATVRSSSGAKAWLQPVLLP